MPYIAGHPFSQKRNEFLLGRHGTTAPGILGLQRGSVDPGFGAADGDFLYNLSGNLVWEAAGVTTTLGAVGGVGTTWESLYANDAAWALTGAFTITQSSNNVFTLNKTATGAGAVFALNNAGTGIDLDVENTNQSDATGIVAQFHYNAASPADDDIPLEIRINADDDGGTETTLSTVRWYQRDVTAATDDTEFYMSLMVAGTERQVLQIDDDTVEIGNGNAAAVLSSSGAFDLVLETNRGTNTGTITITDGVNGNIQIAPDGTGILDLNSGFDIDAASTETCTITVVGTTGNGLAIDSATITSGNVLYVNHSVSGTLSGGNLLALAVDSSNVFTVGESGNVTIAGSAVATAALTLTAGDILVSDGNFALTSTGTTDTFAITNNSILANNAFVLSGSGTFTGTTTTSFFAILHTGGTAGTTAYISSSTATSSVAVVDISAAALTSGSALRITPGSATFTTGGRCIELEGGSAVAGNYLTATTTGAYTGTGMILVTAGAATTGILVSLVSTTGMTSGSLLRMTTSTAGAVATNGICSIRATGAYTSTANAGLLDVQASALVGTGTIVNIMATNGSQLTNTALNVEQTTTGAGYTGDFVRIVGTSTTGDCNLIAVTTASTSAGDGLSITGNGLVAGTSTLVNLVHGTSVLGAGNSMLRITSTGVDTGTTTGTLLDLAATAATSATLVLMTSATLDSGIGVSMVLNGLTTGEGFFLSHTTSVIADGGSLMRLSSTSIDTGGATNGTVLDLIGSGQLAGVCVLETFAALTTGTAHRIVANALTTGVMLDLETSDAAMAGSYIRCFDGAAVDFSVGEDGRVVLAGAAGISAIAITAGDVTTADGAFASAREQVTLGAAATAIAVDSNVVEVTGDAGGNTVTTITGGVAGQYLVLIFVDGNVTINDDDTHGANSVDLVGANTTFADDATLTLVFDGTSWYEVSRSIND